MIRFRPFHFAAILLGLLSLAVPSEAGAQYTSAPLRFEKDPTQTFFSNGHLELGLDVGTTGLGLELATPVTDWMRVRAGFNWMPTFSIPMSFNVMTFGGTETINSSNFERLQELLGQYNLHIDKTADMIAKPTMIDFKFLVDFSPIPDNRDWHVTAGFFVGNKRIGDAINRTNEASTMVGINMYNAMYEWFTEGKFWNEPLPGVSNADGTPFHLDPELGMKQAEKFLRYGRMGMHMGDFKDGKPYYMEPDEYGQVMARCNATVFKPYLGIGYNGCPTSNKRLRIGFDAGVLFWGGSPDVITHDGVNMTKDLVNIPGKVGDYIGFIRALKVLPNVSFKISYTLF